LTREQAEALYQNNREFFVKDLKYIEAPIEVRGNGAYRMQDVVNDLELLGWNRGLEGKGDIRNGVLFFRLKDAGFTEEQSKFILEDARSQMKALQDKAKAALKDKATFGQFDASIDYTYKPSTELLAKLPKAQSDALKLVSLQMPTADESRAYHARFDAEANAILEATRKEFQTNPPAKKTSSLDSLGDPSIIGGGEAKPIVAAGLISDEERLAFRRSTVIGGSVPLYPGGKDDRPLVSYPTYG